MIKRQDRREEDAFIDSRLQILTSEELAILQDTFGHYLVYRVEGKH